MTKTISIKELRQNLPSVRKQMEQGVSFIIIHRSKPIGELRPLKGIERKLRAEALDLFVNPPKDMRIKSKISAVNLVRDERA